MNSNSLVTILLCSHIAKRENDKPLTQSGWSKLFNVLIDNNLSPSDLLEFSESDFKSIGIVDEQYERFSSLMKRASAVPFEIEKLENMGIGILTRSDKAYPPLLKQKLKNLCPPIFYYSGNLNLLNNKYIGFVGSRSIDKSDEDFTVSLTERLINNNYSIVSGGAKGIDSIASETALNSGAYAIEFLSDSLLRKIKSSACVNHIRSGNLLVLSAVNPDAGFNVGNAMSRNKYIYAQSDATIVVKSDYKKGGTWEGALENLKNAWCKEYCWDNSKHNGNIALIQHGAIPIKEDWDCDITKSKKPDIEKGEQIKFF